MRTGSHVVFSIHLHVVFVTKYRRRVLTNPLLEEMKEVFERVLAVNDSHLKECNAEADPVHLLIDLHPDHNISALVSSLKSASRRILRQKYKQEIDKYYWGETAKLWHDSKCIVSCGGAPSEIVKQYMRGAIWGEIGKIKGVEPLIFPRYSSPPYRGMGNCAVLVKRAECKF